MAARGAQVAPPTSYGAKRGSSYRIDVRSPKRNRHPPHSQHHSQPRGAEAFPRPPVELAQFPHDLSHNALETFFKEAIGVQGGTPDGANKNGFDASISSVFNCNTMTFNADALDQDVELGRYFVQKNVEGRKAVQIEHLIGEMTAHLSTNWLQIQREGEDSRFLPIKKPDELQTLRSEIDLLLDR